MMRFSKWQGLGNDFIVLDRRDGGAWPTRDEAIRLCDRHFGVGADGVLIVAPDAVAGARMVVLNADGSRPEMCGNGLRCVAEFLHAAGALGACIATDAGVLPVERVDGLIQVQMGAARLGEMQRVDGWSGRPVDTGNPHFVLYADAPWNPARIEALGPVLSTHAAFSAGANISFAHARSADQLDLVVWERGAGRTLACGTGACAAVAAGWASGVLNGEVAVRLPGGVLTIGGAGDAIWMRGPAHRVFEGEWIAPDISCGA